MGLKISQWLILIRSYFIQIFRVHLSNFLAYLRIQICHSCYHQSPDGRLKFQFMIRLTKFTTLSFHYRRNFSLVENCMSYECAQ